MAEHTKEPWEFDGPRHSIIVWSGPELRVCFMTSDGPCRENARRICAAVNSLSGIPTEALEAGIVGEMVEALRFYAEPYDRQIEMGRKQCTPEWESVPDFYDETDFGRRALAILTKLGGTNGK